MSKVKIIKPAPLKKGDTVGIISPAGSVNDVEKFEKTKCYFESKGYKVKISKFAMEKNNYLAGTDEQRLFDLHSSFEDDEIKAILCSRGGFGTARLLDQIGYDLIQNNPKIFVGYSDITALHSAIFNETGLVTFHGPLALSDFGVDEIDKYTEETFFEILTNAELSPYTFNNPSEYICIKEGKESGQLVGGNLAVLCSLIGTKFFPELQNKILLLEDIGETVYKIDRMLTQLNLSGVLDQIKGLLFARFTNLCEDEEKNAKLEKQAIDLIFEKSKELNIPIGYGFPASHNKTKATLPLGIEYSFDSSENKLVIQENYLDKL